MKQKIHCKPIVICNHHFKHKYFILLGNRIIGEIHFLIKNKILTILYMEIKSEYRNQHYGYELIEYLLSHYKINCIIGETLFEARGFWNKCIKRYGGQRKNISVLGGCTSSFVIPKYDISREEMYELLDIE